MQLSSQQLLQQARQILYAKDDAKILIKLCLGMSIVAVSFGFAPRKPPFGGRFFGSLESIVFAKWGAEAVPYLWWVIAATLFLFALSMWLKGRKSDVANA